MNAIYIEVSITVWLLVLTIEDIKDKQVSLLLTLSGNIIWVSSIYWKFTDVRNITAILLSILPGGILLAIAALTGKAGSGDGLVTVILGLCLGFRNCVFVVFMALIVMSLFSMCVLLSKKGKGSTQIPFIPFLLIGWLILVITTRQGG